MKSLVMRWAEHVVRIGEMRNSYNILFGKPEKGKDQSEDLGVDVRIILECMLNRV
jgi:hypothetical protein